jgi:hypothetical protein
MDKQALLAEVKAQSAQNTITRQELLDAFERGRGAVGDHALFQRLSLAEILYYMGGIITFTGIAVLVWQHWQEFNMLTRILVTLGSGIAAYVVGVLLTHNEKTEQVGQAFFFLSQLLMPTGMLVTFDELGYDINSAGVNAVISCVLLLIALSSYFAFNRVVFIVYAILFGTWFFFAITSYLIHGYPTTWERFYEYRALVTGLSYMLLGYYFSTTEKSNVTGFLYGVGSFVFLGAALALGGWQPNQNVFWELIFPGLSLGFVFLGVYIRSRAFLVFGAIYLMVYILKITAEYFQESFGWPLSLVLAGLLLIATGYGTFYLNRRYIQAA